VHLYFSLVSISRNTIHAFHFNLMDILRAKSNVHTWFPRAFVPQIIGEHEQQRSTQRAGLLFSLCWQILQDVSVHSQRGCAARKSKPRILREIKHIEQLTLYFRLALAIFVNGSLLIVREIMLIPIGSLFLPRIYTRM